MSKNKNLMSKRRHVKLARNKKSRDNHNKAIRQQKESERRHVARMIHLQRSLAQGSVTRIKTAEEEQQLQATVVQSLSPIVGKPVTAHEAFARDVNMASSILNPTTNETEEKTNETP